LGFFCPIYFYKKNVLGYILADFFPQTHLVALLRLYLEKTHKKAAAVYGGGDEV
jgi:hypothetical protein